MDQTLISDFLRRGATQKQAVNALQVFQELVEVKRYWDVEYHYKKNLQKICLTARKRKHEPLCAFIPIATTEGLSFDKMQSIIEDIQGDGIKSVYLVFISADLTTVYYEISEGLQEAMDVSAKHLRENKQQKRDVEIRKNRAVLEHGALCGIGVTINKRTAQDSG